MKTETPSWARHIQSSRCPAGEWSALSNVQSFTRAELLAALRTVPVTAFQVALVAAAKARLTEQGKAK